jgi:ubiquinone/menaquinone biosynthesis C-methylase UbiE
VTHMDPVNPEALNARHRSAYDRVSARFAEANAEMPVSVRESAECFLNEIGSPARILELGCGHGRDVAWFEAHGINVVGADLSSGMLAEATTRAHGPFLQLDMRHLAFGSDAFSGVWCNAAILHLPKVEVRAALCGIRRVLVPQGLLFVSIQVGEDETWESVCYAQTVDRFFARYAVGEFRLALESAGFAVIDQCDLCEGPKRHWAHYLSRRVGG